MFRINYSVILLCISITFCSAQKIANLTLPEIPASPRSAGNFLYSLSTSNAAYTDLVNPISINNGEAWDEPEYFLSIGFSFELLEDEVEGFAFYGSGSMMRTPTGFPNAYAYIFPFEADLIDRGYIEEEDVSLSPISYVVEGTPGNRIFKLEFKNAGSYFEMSEYNTLDMFINFQMWLYEGSNIIQFRFGPNNIDDPEVFYDGGGGAIIGVADFDEEDDYPTDVHLLVGNASNPVLSSSVDGDPISGTPPNGTVYTLYIDVPLDVNLLLSQINSYCEPNSTIEAEVSGGVPPYIYAWSNGESTAVINVVDAGTYTVTVTDQIGNTETRVAMITTPDPMTLGVEVTDETGDGANDGTAEVTASDGLPPYSYEWDNGETTSLIEDLVPGIYQVTVTDNAGCSETAEVVVNPFGCPDLLLEASIQDMQCFEVCEGVITITEVVNGVGPFLYEWDNGANGDVNNLLCAGVYAVTVTDANLCIVSASYEITSPTPVVANASSTDETLGGLNDGTATVSPFGGTPPYNYVWSNGAFTQMITGLSPGTYSVIVADINNCNGFDTVVVDAGPCATLIGQVTDATCFDMCDGSIEVFHSGLPPVLLTWTGPSGGSLEGELCAGEYSITATDSEGCSVVETFTVGQPNELIASTGSTAESVEGEDGMAWVIPSGGTPPYTYLWSNNSTDSLIVGLLADTYFITLTDSHGCIKVDSVQVEPFSCFHIIPVEVQDMFCQDLCDGLILVTILGGVGPFEYAWSTGDTSNIVFDLCAGWYSVTVTDLGQGGCSDFLEVEITQPDSFYNTVDEIIHVTDSTAGAIHISVSGGTSPYFPVWFGPELFVSFEEDITGLEPGLYILNLFDSNDCEIVDTIEVLDMTVGIPTLPEGAVSIYPNPATDFIYVASEVSGDFEVSLFSASGTAFGKWTNVNRFDVADLAPGLYIVAFSNAKGRYIKKVIIE